MEVDQSPLVIDDDPQLIEDHNPMAEDKKDGKRGRRPGRRSSDKTDVRAKLERSRQSARECRARKKLRYQYLEELVSDREKAVLALRQELDLYKNWCQELDNGHIPEGLQAAFGDPNGIKSEIVGSV